MLKMRSVAIRNMSRQEALVTQADPRPSVPAFQRVYHRVGLPQKGVVLAASDYPQGATGTALRDGSDPPKVVLNGLCFSGVIRGKKPKWSEKENATKCACSEPQWRNECCY